MNNVTTKISFVKSITALFLTVSILSACKKEETTSSTNVSISAPNCLVSSFTGSYNGNFKYDDSRRIIETSSNNDSSKTTYSYQGNKMIESSTYLSSDSQSYNTVTTHYLNASGFIQKSVQTPTPKEPNNTYETEYHYNAEGYLLREIQTSGYKSPFDSVVMNYYSGKSYTYENGNQSKVYSLKFDDTGKVTDSSLTQATIYDLSLPGKIESFSAWISRKGKANKNEIKSIEYFEGDKSEIETHTYTFDANGNPTSVKMTGSSNALINITWICN